jgi:hypothetical protein
MGRLSSILRGDNARSDDPRDVERLLDRGLKRWMRDDGDPMQFIGFVHTRASYEQWRTAQLARMPGAGVPTLPPATWPLVLWVMKPAAVSAFVRKGTAHDLYVAPQVGMFTDEVARETALAAVIGSYLADLRGPVQIAPPLLAFTLRGRTQLRLAPLERTWTLPATEVVGVGR